MRARTIPEDAERATETDEAARAATAARNAAGNSARKPAQAQGRSSHRTRYVSVATMRSAPGSDSTSTQPEIGMAGSLEANGETVLAMSANSAASTTASSPAPSNGAKPGKSPGSSAGKRAEACPDDRSAQAGPASSTSVPGPMALARPGEPLGRDERAPRFLDQRRRLRAGGLVEVGRAEGDGLALRVHEDARQHGVGRAHAGGRHGGERGRERIPIDQDLHVGSFLSMRVYAETSRKSATVSADACPAAAARFLAAQSK